MNSATCSNNLLSLYYELSLHSGDMIWAYCDTIPKTVKHGIRKTSQSNPLLGNIKLPITITMHAHHGESITYTHNSQRCLGHGGIFKSEELMVIKHLLVSNHSEHPQSIILVTEKLNFIAKQNNR
jgi:hypothetical protein